MKPRVIIRTGKGYYDADPPEPKDEDEDRPEPEPMFDTLEEARGER